MQKRSIFPVLVFLDLVPIGCGSTLGQQGIAFLLAASSVRITFVYAVTRTLSILLARVPGFA